MKLEQVLAFHPGEGASTAALEAGITAAEAKRAELLKAAAVADRVRADGLLTADDKVLAAAEKDAAEARRGAERINALLPTIRAELHKANGREAVADLHEKAALADQVVAGYEKWQRETWPKVEALLMEGIYVETSAHQAVEMYRDLVTARCQWQDVRDHLAGRPLPNPKVTVAGAVSFLITLAGAGVKK